MRISLESYVGGVVSKQFSSQLRTVDLGQLPAGESSLLQATLQQLDLAQLPPTMLKQHPQPGDFVYTLTVENGMHYEIRFHREVAPTALNSLIDLLERYKPASP